jgi:hypothetical protein
MDSMTAAPLVAGVGLSLVAGLVRMRAWHAAVSDACPRARIRYRDVAVAHLGGVGFNGVIPAHGGDAIKLALLKRRSDAPFGLLLGSLAPPAALEAMCTALLLGWALSGNYVGTPWPGQIPPALVGAAAALAAGVLWLLARRAPRLLRDVRRGMAALRRPRLLFADVAPWVLAARVVRLGAIACFMTAVGLPVTMAGVLLVMAIQMGVGSLGPASSPVRIAVLSASLPAAIGGQHVGLETATALLVGTQLAVMVTNLAISVVVLAVTLRTTSPRRVVRYGLDSAKSLRPARTTQPAAPITKP